jgi:hypothetical protein
MEEMNNGSLYSSHANDHFYSDFRGLRASAAETQFTGDATRERT